MLITLAQQLLNVCFHGLLLIEFPRELQKIVRVSLAVFQMVVICGISLNQCLKSSREGGAQWKCYRSL